MSEVGLELEYLPCRLLRRPGLWYYIAGGTLQPSSELRDRLFPKLPKGKVNALAICHLIWFLWPTHAFINLVVLITSDLS